MNWNALAKTLDITTEMRPVYRAGKRGFLTKDAAIRDAIKGIALALDYCDCSPSEPDTVDGRGDPGNYCGCRERIEEMIDVLTPIAKRLPEAQAHLDRSRALQRLLQVRKILSRERDFGTDQTAVLHRFKQVHPV